MSLFRRRAPRPETPHLFDGPRWQIEAIRDLEVFFTHLEVLFPEAAFLYLAESAWSEEGKRFVREYALEPDPDHPLPRDFDRAPRFRLDGALASRLASMASRHAAPELAIHIGVTASGVSQLEWFDLPDDPMSVARTVPETRVATFSTACRVAYRAID